VSTLFHAWHALQVPLASCMGEFCGIAPPETARQMLGATCLQNPLPASVGNATMSAIVLPVLARHRTAWLEELGLLPDAVSAAVRCIRHKQYAVKVAAVRAFGRMMKWAVQADKVEDVAGLMEVAKTALAPDQDRGLHQVSAPVLSSSFMFCLQIGGAEILCIVCLRISEFSVHVDNGTGAVCDGADASVDCAE
jgi:hypothetical protein